MDEQAILTINKSKRSVSLLIAFKLIIQSITGHCHFQTCAFCCEVPCSFVLIRESIIRIMPNDFPMRLFVHSTSFFNYLSLNCIVCCLKIKQLQLTHYSLYIHYYENKTAITQHVLCIYFFWKCANNQQHRSTNLSRNSCRNSFTSTKCDE